MHIGRLMARLNPKNVRFDVGSGGIPELTPQDIAAALGCVEDGIGREMLCQVWWPDGARLTESNLLEVLTTAQRMEWQRREDEMLNAMLAVAQNGSRAQRAFAYAHENRWPGMVRMDHGLPHVNPHYASIRMAVLREISGTGLCPLCKGHTVIQSATGPICVCPLCTGSGHQSVSDRSRAEACGIDWKTYRQRWAGVYEWTALLCLDSQRRASHQMLRAIGGYNDPQ